jgi:hypothetical protein
MLVATTCLVVLALALFVRLAGHKQPLDAHEVHRLRRFSERLQREESLPYE